MIQIGAMKTVLLVLYFLLGVIIGIADGKAAVIYFTVIPVQFYFLLYHYKKKHFVLTCFFAILLLSVGFSSMFLFLNSEEADMWGFTAVGLFDFSLTSFFSAYIKVFVFILVVHVLSLYKNKNKVDVFKHLKEYFLKTIKLATKESYTILLIFTAIIFCFLSVWMFNNSIGMTGIRPKQLPYHLTGILFHLRGKVFPLVFFFLYIKSSNKNLSFIFIVISSIIGGFSACSKGLPILILAPIIYESILTKHKVRAGFGIVLSILLFGIISFSRELLFAFDKVQVDLETTMAYSIEALSNVKSNWIIDLLDTFTGRLYGANTLVLADQYHITTFADLINYYLGVPAEVLVPNYSETIFGITLPDNMAYGVGLGYMGTMILLSSGSYLYVIIQAVFIGFLFRVIEFTLHKNLRNTDSTFIGLMSVLLAAYIVLSLIEASGMKIVYLLLLVLFIMPSVLKHFVPPPKKNIQIFIKKW